MAPHTPPVFLHVYSSSLMTFIDLVGEDLFRSLPVRGVMAASEVFLAGQQVHFEREFGIQVAHWYGQSEYAILAYRCRQCQGFHFYPTYGRVELLDSDTEGCKRIVASSFNRIGTQFVRYDTGDLAVESTGTCAADQFPRVEAVVGRSQETFIDGTGRRRSLGPYLFGIHGRIWDQIRDLQIIQYQSGLLRIRLVATPRADRGLIQRTLERRMPMVGLTFEYVPVIERSPNGKRSYFVCSENVDAPSTLPCQLDGEAISERARRPRARGWAAVAAVAITAISLLVTGSGGSRHVNIRTKRDRHSIVSMNHVVYVT